MRILVAMPHYFRAMEDRVPLYASQIEPLGRIAALNAAIVSLHRNFGPERHTLAGAPLRDDGGANVLDIVIIVSRDDHVLAECGFDRSIFSIEQVDGDPMRLPFHAIQSLGERLGAYDFYCYLEDDLIIYDREFFTKLVWFQKNFGPQAMLAPVRFEMSSRGVPAKVVTDPVLPEELLLPFRRPGQRREIGASWHGVTQTFEIPTNPHAGCFFLSQEQMMHWVRQPSFSDRDDSWVGPLESGATFATGRTFDIYKPTKPDPFFLEIEHYGTRYAQIFSPQGWAYGDSPLLSIAQNAMREIERAGTANPELSQMLRRWVKKGDAIEQTSKLERAFRECEQTRLQMQFDLQQKTTEIEAQLQSQYELRQKVTEIEAQLQQTQYQFQQKVTEIEAQLAGEQATREAFERSPRRLLKAMLKAVRTRLS